MYTEVVINVYINLKGTQFAAIFGYLGKQF